MGKNNIELEIQNDILRCKKAIQDNDNSKIQELILQITSTYSGIINNISEGIETCNAWSREFKNNDLLKDINILKRKLEVSLAMYEQKALKSGDKDSSISIYNNGSNTNINSNTNTNCLDNNLSFDEVRKEFENCGYLPEEEINQVICKLNEIEEILSSRESKNKKWDKLKNVMSWLSTKGVDIALKILPLIVNGLNQKQSS